MTLNIAAIDNAVKVTYSMIENSRGRSDLSRACNLSGAKNATRRKVVRMKRIPAPGKW
jgi:hypothetical protein